jgi:hypothetical protein
MVVSMWGNEAHGVRLGKRADGLPATGNLQRLLYGRL